jgi:hypothetical protein
MSSPTITTRPLETLWPELVEHFGSYEAARLELSAAWKKAQPRLLQQVACELLAFAPERKRSLSR